MKILFFGLIVILVCVPSPIWHPVVAQNPNSSAPTRYSLRTIGPYNISRIGYESLPVQVLGAGGGKLAPNAKFKIQVSMLKNGTQKNIKAVKISCFIFGSNDRDKVVETRQTSLIPVDLPAFETRKVEILVGYVDDIPLLRYAPGKEFHLELAVTEVHYDDGTIWQAVDLPQKLTPDDPF
jgi:hypothetical protein